MNGFIAQEIAKGFVSTRHVKVAETVVLKPDEITTRIQDHHV